MTIEAIERDFRREVSERVRVAPEGPRRYRVFTPFRFDDGDHLAIALRQKDGGWVLSDEAHTCMRFGDDLGEEALRRGVRGAASPFRVEDRDGELTLRIPDERYGEALSAFVRTLLEIAEAAQPVRGRIAAVTPPAPTPRGRQSPRAANEGMT